MLQLESKRETPHCLGAMPTEYDIRINVTAISREDALIALEQVRHHIEEGFTSGFATSDENDDGVVPSSFNWVSTLPAS